MASEQAERRRRQPRRPAAYYLILTVSAAVALGAAWNATHPNGRAPTYQRP